MLAAVWVPTSAGEKSPFTRGVGKQGVLDKIFPVLSSLGALLSARADPMYNPYHVGRPDDGRGGAAPAGVPR